MYVALNDINLIVIHVLGQNNTVVDLLSRWTGSALDVSILQQLVKKPIWFQFPDKFLHLHLSIEQVQHLSACFAKEPHQELEMTLLLQHQGCIS